MRTKTMNMGISGGRATFALALALTLNALGLTTASWADTRLALADASSASSLADLRRDTLETLRAEALAAATDALEVPAIDRASIEVELIGLPPAMPPRYRTLVEVELRSPETRGDRLAASPVMDAMESSDPAS